MNYQQFIFKRYSFDRNTQQLELVYGYDDTREFRELYRFDFELADYDEAALDRACQLLFFLAGVSYYKIYLAPEITMQAGDMDEPLAAFLAKTYQRGLGEFFYVNNMDPQTPITFPVNHAGLAPANASGLSGTLVGIGGGKDSLVSVELLAKAGHEFTTWSLNHRPQLTPLAERIGGRHLWVERTIDPALFDLKNDPAAYNGHIPISAIFAAAGAVTAILAGKQHVLVSNESSASEPTLHYQGAAINHQYSKSLEFEQGFQVISQHLFGESGPHYFSFLRPFSEVRIAELFVQLGGFAKYRDVFSSCNQAFTHSSDHIFWDGICAKCAFVFLALTPFVARSDLELLFNGKNLLLDPALEPTYRQLLGIEGDKPLDCVGDVKESRSAMRLAQQQYPELTTYAFEIPSDYDFRAASGDAMPAEFQALLPL